MGSQNTVDVWIDVLLICWEWLKESIYKNYWREKIKTKQTHTKTDLSNNNLQHAHFKLWKGKQRTHIPKKKHISYEKRPFKLHTDTYIHIRTYFNSKKKRLLWLFCCFYGFYAASVVVLVTTVFLYLL